MGSFRQCLLLGLLLLCITSCLTAPAAAASGHGHGGKSKAKAARPVVAAHGGARAHKHFPRMDPQQQKAMALLRQQPPEQQQHADVQQVAGAAPLLPSCVPLYVTDLLIPPPMPLAANALAKKKKLAPQGKDNKLTTASKKGSSVGIAAVLQQPEEEYEVAAELMRAYEPPMHVRTASVEDIDVADTKRRHAESLDDDYYRLVEPTNKPRTKHSSSSDSKSLDSAQRSSEEDTGSDDHTGTHLPRTDVVGDAPEDHHKNRSKHKKSHRHHSKGDSSTHTKKPLSSTVTPPETPEPAPQQQEKEQQHDNKQPPAAENPIQDDKQPEAPKSADDADAPAESDPLDTLEESLKQRAEELRRREEALLRQTGGDEFEEVEQSTPPPAAASPTQPQPKQQQQPPQQEQQQQQAAPETPQKDPNAKQVPPSIPVFDPYDISVQQIQQQVLPPTSLAGPGCPGNFNPTDLFAYGPAGIQQPFHSWPGYTIEAKRNVPAHITWINDLKNANGDFLPHILRDSIDQTIHWANPGAIGGSVDSNPCHLCSTPTLFTCPTDPACVTASTTTYTGPVPTITHVHGQTNLPDWADGYTEAWFLPDARNLAGFTPVGSWYNTFQSEYTAQTGLAWAPGTNTGRYPNTQRSTTLWYHDHTLGLTRTNVYAGMAGFYLIREKFPSIANGPELPGLPYPAYDGIIPLNLVRELPLAIQDRSFTVDSQLWYPVAAHAPGTFLPNGPLHPLWIPEYSATVTDPVTGLATNMLMMTVNGRTYPRQVVYPDAYRLRILNGCNSRTMQLRFARSSNPAINPLSGPDVATTLPFYVVGNDDGFMPALGAPMTTLQMGPAERYDVVIDFSSLLPGEFVYLLNNGPETDTAIYDGTNNGVGLTFHTAQIMRFDVQPLPAGQVAQPFDLQQQVALHNALIADWAATGGNVVLPATPARQVSLLENLDPNGIPIEVLLGTATNNVNGPNTATPQLWMDPVTADSASSTAHVWDIINLSADSHPIHLHHVDFEYLGRFALAIDPVTGAFTKTTTPVPNQDLDPLLVWPCAASPTGSCPVPKDTQLLLPGTYTRIAFQAPALAGLYVWHCHLVEHEDNEMMVPHCFGTPTYLNPKTGLPMCPGPNRR